MVRIVLGGACAAGALVCALGFWDRQTTMVLERHDRGGISWWYTRFGRQPEDEDHHPALFAWFAGGFALAVGAFWLLG